MSVNTAQTQDGLGIVLFYGERLLVTYEGCKLALSGSGQQPSGKFSGSAFLTSHRVIFLSKDKSPKIKSLSMPFIYMRGVEIKQPTFGPNAVEGYVRSESNHWQGEIHFKLSFYNGGAIEFGKALIELGTRACKLQKNYKVPSAPPACEIYSCPPPAYTPFQTDPYYNSFMQPHPAFSPAPTDCLYQTNAPPPYPGVIPPSYSEVTAASDPMATYPGAPPPYLAPNLPYPTGYPQAGPTYAPYPTANPQFATTGYYYPQDPNTFYAPPLNQAATTPIEPEDKKNK
ncbi:hypothetical protein Aperf_G00000002272 [Anoplocephala perfoliata]